LNPEPAGATSAYKSLGNVIENILRSRGVDPYGTGGHVPPIFGLGGMITNVPPPIFLE